MPSAMAATNTRRRGESVARFSSAGPGHSPHSPQPIPTSAAPTTSGASIAVLSGHTHLGANRGGRSFTRAKPMPLTTSAVAISTSRLASQAPRISRKPSTFSVRIMPETSSPQPNTKPQINPAIASMALASEPMTRDRDHRHRRRHEDRGRCERAGRDACYAADAVPGCATAAEPRAEPDQEPGGYDHRPVRRHLRLAERIAEEASGERRSDQAGDEGGAPAPVGGGGIDEAAEDAADAGDAAGRQHQHQSGEPDQRAAGRTRYPP